MKSTRPRPRRRPASPATTDLVGRLAERVIGQRTAIETIVPYIEIYQAGLNPENRPAATFALLGPTGTGKTRTVEALAEVMHGSPKNLLRIDCAEFQTDHELSKLIGAPPGYLGHRETHALLNQVRINAVASDRSNLSILLFDEIEKAAPAMMRLLLGVLDNASLRLGDNSTVNFERCAIFFTSNVGSTDLHAALTESWGFGSNGSDKPRRLDAIVRKAFTRQAAPEFINRLDAIITYHPLGVDAIRDILDLELRKLDRLIQSRMGSRSFSVAVGRPAQEFLIAQGVSREYGARELKRVIHRHVLQPLARMLSAGEIAGNVDVRLNRTHDALILKSE
jgi:ATP-dependent Clp protease ATP-binding subunit ClpA